MKGACECPIIHRDKVDKVKKQMLSDDILFDLAELFKIFGDIIKMKIICTLKENKLCLCNIAYITNSTQLAISNQLRILKQTKLIKARKAVYYSLADNHVI
ncbi:MAG: metalloregulator ArsR/SmtB family transcription factor [bacterium]|nr:metalloregulator ArsR/SmtB family transcription factor [bacterium]